MAFLDDLQEACLGARDGLDGLARAGIAEERDEVARMPGAQRDADFAVGLEAADAGAVSGARVDHDEGALGRVGRHAGRRDDAQQRVVDRLGQRARVGEHLVGEHEHRWHAFAFVLARLIAALAQDVHEQDRALPGIHAVFERGPRPRGEWGKGAELRQCAGGFRLTRLVVVVFGQAAGFAS
jgi:hypothetical protein